MKDLLKLTNSFNLYSLKPNKGKTMIDKYSSTKQSIYLGGF